ncbi:hypothetical protein ABH15_11475 [Methanoculleus taiwanensis]|uniref:Uncharacterized protein n=1 Tax=Methanoculleus taiwanensis TaxID=1550565 RepID=A0A498H0I3_9EURY|nr:hypothetical protein [Methanoculleus taiwanensis]RXE55366.1 hypothetical protein ABH15_11475 [Methanoculleus taiwanensis]
MHRLLHRIPDPDGDDRDHEVAKADLCHIGAGIHPGKRQEDGGVEHPVDQEPCAAEERPFPLNNIQDLPVLRPPPEQGYHLVDLSRQIPLKEGGEFVIALGFAAQDYAADIAEPLVYVASDTSQANETYRTPSGPADGRCGWKDCAALHNGSIFYVQGFTAAPRQHAPLFAPITGAALSWQRALRGIGRSHHSPKTRHVYTCTPEEGLSYRG